MKAKARQLEDEKKFLKEQVSSLQRCLERNIFQCKDTLKVQLRYKYSNEKLLCQLSELPRHSGMIYYCLTFLQLMCTC